MTGQLMFYEWNFKTPFRLAHGTRTGTPAVLLMLSAQGKTGYGEATFPPYLPETAQPSIKALEKVLPQIENFAPQQVQEIGALVDGFQLSPFTRNILVNALTDLYLRVHQLPTCTLHQVPAVRIKPPATFTITKGDDLTGEKAEIARHFPILKLKLDGLNDLNFAERVVQKLGTPFCVDANQGWEKLGMEESILLAEQLKTLGCILIEQPFDKKNHERHAVLSSLHILPVFADEGIQNMDDFLRYGQCYDGINIKLLKCGGLDRALLLAQLAHAGGKQLIVGCMSESSCGCAAALVLEPLASYLDLDGPWLINNDLFTGLALQDGSLLAEGEEGFGIEFKV